ncbi:hypothetical protein K7X08_014964 [Anisodus acutangulus]|uniref:Uncharacterized protein n=1 Tax=Anisodus acutangulus TaxID=402998 RepID=A0A9Q1L2W4_9SOLA|nr:hypothetical protein K7X08_014964 [Anisodus acutangulus]
MSTHSLPVVDASNPSVPAAHAHSSAFALPPKVFHDTSHGSEGTSQPKKKKSKKGDTSIDTPLSTSTVSPPPRSTTTPMVSPNISPLPSPAFWAHESSGSPCLANALSLEGLLMLIVEKTELIVECDSLLGRIPSLEAKLFRIDAKLDQKEQGKEVSSQEVGQLHVELV